MSPPVLATQVFPKEALAPLFLVAFGFGMTPKVLIAALICFFPLAVNTAIGLRATPRDHWNLMTVIGSTPWQRFVHCDLLFAAPYITASLRVCATLGLVGAVVGEFVGSSAGLGHVIRSAASDIGTDRIFASLMLLGLIGGLLYGIAVSIDHFVGRRLRWAQT